MECHIGWMILNQIHHLVSFDFCSESCITTPIPSDLVGLFDSYLVWSVGELVILNESIAFILNDTKISTFHISVLGELGVKESWTKLFIIGPSPRLIVY